MKPGKKILAVVVIIIAAFLLLAIFRLGGEIKGIRERRFDTANVFRINQRMLFFCLYHKHIMGYVGEKKREKAAGSGRIERTRWD